MNDANPAPTVFISYSWENDAHKVWVRELAEQLRINGVDVRLDQWHVAPGQSLTQFMETEVHRCEFVVIVCTRAYARKSLERAGGVGYEQQIISGNIVAGVARERFIPIVRDGEFEPGPNCAIPGHFLGIYAVDMRDETVRERSVESLLRAIYRQPALIPPPLGPAPNWAKGITETPNSEIEMIRLPSMEIDGWELESGVVRHQISPDTFEIPDEALRRNLKPGDVVKLIFNIDVSNDEVEEIAGERMWVLVHHQTGPYYVGELNNVPASSAEQEFLDLGDQVIFLPEHVISIVNEKGDEVQIAEDTKPQE